MQYVLIVVGDGADKVNRMIFVIVLHDITLEESLETTENQCMYGGLLNIFCQEWRKTCQETIGERLPVYPVDDFGRSQSGLIQEFFF